jgi:protein-disulfide isomerase
MKKNKVFVVVVVLAAVAAFAALGMFSRGGDSSQTAPAVVATEKLVRDHSPVKGSPEAPVTLVEFLDPECEACRALHPVVKKLLAEYQGQVRLVIRYMPFHGNSLYAAAALEEAREAGKFDQALDVLFERQPEWGDHARPRPDLIPEILQSIGMDPKALRYEDIVPKHKWKVELDYADGMNAGVRYTPTFFVNGQMTSDIGYDALKSAIEKALRSAQGL